LLCKIEASGGTVAINGKRLTYDLPTMAAQLLEELRLHRADIVKILRTRGPLPSRCSVHKRFAQSWWWRPATEYDGDWLCGHCHPNPHDARIWPWKPSLVEEECHPSREDALAGQDGKPSEELQRQIRSTIAFSTETMPPCPTPTEGVSGE
jgi:hypothetical protein